MVPPPVRTRFIWFPIVVALPMVLIVFLKPLFQPLFMAVYGPLAEKFVHGRISTMAFFIYIMAGSLVTGGLCLIPMSLYLRSWGRKFKRYDRWRRQRCTECDYDLRAHTGGGTCPECSAPIPEKFQPPNPVPSPQRPRSLLLTIPLLALPLVAVIWIDPVLERWYVGDPFDLLTAIAYSSVAMHIINRHVIYYRWKKCRCTRCRCDLRLQLSACADNPAICPQCGTPVPAAISQTAERHQK